LDTAQSFFERGVQLEPDEGDALGGLARIFKKRGKADLAREYATRALQQDLNDK
jgi:hypothetical protein